MATFFVAMPLLLAALNIIFSPNCPPWNPLQLAEGEVSVDKMENWSEPFLLLDARTPSHYEQEHIPGALNLSVAHFEDQITGVLDVWYPGLTLIIYCDSRQCGSSKVIAERLRTDFQIEQVFVLKGGWESWKGQRVSKR
jgi:rhodanese-related sulfurtransferase